MTYHWFSSYSGDKWTPEMGYNETFRNQILLLRKWFGLERAGVGKEQGTNLWREYRLQGRTIYICVDSLTWTDYRKVHINALREYYWIEHNKGGSGDYITPIFKLGVRIARQDGQKKKNIFAGNIKVEFPRSYPSSPPLFRIDTLRYKATKNSHAQHIYRGGVPCILASHSDWQPRRDTIISGLNAAFDWLVWHHQKFGW